MTAQELLATNKTSTVEEFKYYRPTPSDVQDYKDMCNSCNTDIGSLTKSQLFDYLCEGARFIELHESEQRTIKELAYSSLRVIDMFNNHNIDLEKEIMAIKIQKNRQESAKELLSDF